MHTWMTELFRPRWKMILGGLGLIVSTSITVSAAEDPRIKALNEFLWTRIAANNVIEYTYMTDRLKEYYGGDKKVKVRRESSVLLSFSYDPGKIEARDGDKSFDVEVVGIWKNLNDHLIGEIDERDTFIQTPRGWFADRIKFGAERPTAKAIVEGFEAPKEYRDSIRVLKIVMRAWADRDGDTAMQHTSIGLGQQFQSPDELRQIFIGLSNPHHVAYAIRRIANTGRDKVEFDVELYEMVTGDPRLISSKVKVGVKRFDSAWLVVAWAPEKSNTPAR
ncbi:MAG: hypothetical protein LAO31_08700 [Acidobacteriia bacterium]|nr:hypothetical protein [Terriglobia bacterium]